MAASDWLAGLSISVRGSWISEDVSPSLPPPPGYPDLHHTDCWLGMLPPGVLATFHWTSRLILPPPASTGINYWFYRRVTRTKNPRTGMWELVVIKYLTRLQHFVWINSPSTDSEDDTKGARAGPALPVLVVRWEAGSPPSLQLTGFLAHGGRGGAGRPPGVGSEAGSWQERGRIAGRKSQLHSPRPAFRPAPPPGYFLLFLPGNFGHISLH